MPNKNLIALKEKKHAEHLQRVCEIKKTSGFVSVTSLQPFYKDQDYKNHSERGGSKYV